MTNVNTTVNQRHLALLNFQISLLAVASIKCGGESPFYFNSISLLADPIYTALPGQWFGEGKGLVKYAALIVYKICLFSGRLYKFNGEMVEPIPMDVDSLLGTSLRYSLVQWITVLNKTVLTVQCTVYTTLPYSTQNYSNNIQLQSSTIHNNVEQYTTTLNNAQYTTILNNTQQC